MTTTRVYGRYSYRYLAMENHHFEWVDVGVGFDGSRVSKMLWSSSQIPKERPLQRLCSTQDPVHMLFVIMPKQIIRFRKSMGMTNTFRSFSLSVVVCAGLQRSQWKLYWTWNGTGPLQCPWRQKAVFSSVRRIKFQANRAVKNTRIPSHYTGWLTGIPFITRNQVGLFWPISHNVSIISPYLHMMSQTMIQYGNPYKVGPPFTIAFSWCK